MPTTPSEGEDRDEGLISGGVRADALATRARIVAAAEKLFAERGIDAVSLVEIGKAAGQRNRSAVQYHFGDKPGLLHAILDKHTPGIEQERHRMMDELEGRGTPDLRGLVEVLVLPVARKLRDPDGGIAFVRINAALIGHPTYPLLTLDAQRVNRGADRLRRLVARAVPALPEPLWVPRWLLVTGLLFHGMADWSRAAEAVRGPQNAASRELFVSQLVDAIVAVAEAPLSADTGDRLTALKREAP